jgi:hypothetical protein
MEADDKTVPEKVIDEIKAVCAKHDVACLAVVASVDGLAFLRKVDPSWSCAWMEPVPGDTDGAVAVRIRSKVAEYPGATLDERKASQKLQVEATTGMFIAFMNWAQLTLDNMTQITAMLGKHFPEIMHHEKWRRGRW